MNTLQTREEVDYRTIYAMEDVFRDSVFNAYIMNQTPNNPPTFLRLLEELSDIQAEIFFENNRDSAFDDLSKDQKLDLIFGLALKKEEDQMFVLSRMNERFMEDFTRDVFLFLINNNYFFLEGLNNDLSIARPYNEPFTDSW